MSSIKPAVICNTEKWRNYLIFIKAFTRYLTAGVNNYAAITWKQVLQVIEVQNRPSTSNFAEIRI